MDIVALSSISPNRLSNLDIFKSLFVTKDWKSKTKMFKLYFDSTLFVIHLLFVILKYFIKSKKLIPYRVTAKNLEYFLDHSALDFRLTPSTIVTKLREERIRCSSCIRCPRILSNLINCRTGRWCCRRKRICRI